MQAASASLYLQHLLDGKEAFAICAYLPPSDVARLTAVVSWDGGCGDRRVLWQTYFIIHWGTEFGVRPNTKVQIMFSWLDEDWLHHTAFNGSRTVMEHILWFVPSFRRAVASKRVQPAPQPRPVLRWQLACHVRARYPSSTGMARLLRCFICDTLEVSPPVPAPCHFRQRWMKPCSCSVRLSHRACLERRLMEKDRTSRSWLPGHMTALVENPRVTLSCEECGDEFLIAMRFPETFGELCLATIREWRWLSWRVFVMLLCFLWLLTLADRYCTVPGGDSHISRLEWCTLLVFTACMMSLSMTRRCQYAVEIMRRKGRRVIYFRGFAVFASLSYLTGLRMVDPSFWGSAAEMPLLSGLHAIHMALYTSSLGKAGLSAVSFTYLVAASGVIFLFWKTSVRVFTVADAIVPASSSGVSQLLPGAPMATSRHECGLCQLGLCLDNHYM